MVAGLHAGHARADLADDARALVAEDRREDAFAVEAVERVGVGVADAGRHDLDQHFALLGPLEVDLDDLERLLGFEGDGGAGLHSIGPLEVAAATSDSAPQSLRAPLATVNGLGQCLIRCRRTTRFRGGMP